MKQVYFFMAALFFLTSCNGVDRLYADGKDQKVIDKVMKRERKHVAKVQDVKLAEKAFERIQSNLLEELTYANQSDSEEKWVRIYNLADDIDDLQRQVKRHEPVRAKNGYVAQFEYVEVGELKEKSGRKAAEFFYKRGNESFVIAKQLERPHKKAREAYYDFKKVRRYDKSFDVSRELEKAKKLGTIRVATQIGSNVGFRNISFSSQYSGRINGELNQMVGHTNSEWIEQVHGSPIGQKDIDYVVMLRIADIDISDRRESSSTRNYDKQVREAVRDAGGNVVQDSLGNTLYTYRNISASVRTTTYSIETDVDLDLTILDAKTSRQVYSYRYSDDKKYEDEDCSISGDEDALPSSVRCNGNSISFPSEDKMVQDVLQKMRSRVRNDIKRQIERLD